MRRNNRVSYDGGAWITRIEVHGVGLAVHFRIRTDESYLGGHHRCLALTRMGVEVLAFVLSVQSHKKSMPMNPNGFELKTIVDLLDNQYLVQAAFDGWVWSEGLPEETHAVADTVSFHVSQAERELALRLIRPVDQFFTKQVQPLIVTQSEQKTIPRNSLGMNKIPPLLSIPIPEKNYDDLGSLK